ncbi:MAG: outer membrane lipoprotein-sorting protein [Candidatus Aminicenantes bacterium]|nr:outer membrane lipoprotein-sorting protein [Candidatus Aminicenantes bacterium]
MKKIIVVCIAIFMVGALCQAQSVDEIISKNLEVKGGAEKIRALKTIKANTKTGMGGMEIKGTMWFKHPNMFKMEMLISEKKMIFAFDGSVAWQVSPLTGSEDPQELTGQMAEMVKDNADMMDDPFLDYKKKGFKYELVGKEDMEGTQVFKLKLIKKSGKIVYFFLDAESFIEIKSIMTNKIGEQDITTEMFYGDYKEVAGVMYPHSIATKQNGQDQGTIVFESVEPNVELDDAFFKMPPAKKKTGQPQKKEK